MNEFVSEQFWEALEARQDEIIARLDELNASIESALAEFGDAPPDLPLEEAA